MKKPLKIRSYSPKEELLNVITHGAGLVLSVLGLFLLIFKALEFDSRRLLLSFLIFGSSLILLYLASTLYHSTRDRRKRFSFKIFDHIAIFILIAGTYTPFALVTLQGRTGWIILGVVWGIALFGTILKLFFTGRFKILSTLLYVGMGWVIIFAIKPLMENLSSQGLLWLLGGGLAYTIGAILYSISRINYNHAIFHFFVLLGSYCHYMAIYNHVSP
ncbi:PAQR family membrane homeostasis protein TrhA [Salinimicrobium sediminilitoris]|uniref:PAQR family membrane homeostasis protein TrhA n=1 Tax=Salinimicrobium sediminilitoris TaxID=2876715 RepID=UPI001E4FBB79|nr:hemolysin III family protein [Salinimicrobium sediminilitoris]MCC8361333.1 hemolysin III family protein [Salinimicrobium sediminilitoris]